MPPVSFLSRFLVCPDFLPHKADVGKSEGNQHHRRQTYQMGPYQQQALPEAQIAGDRAHQLIHGHRVDGAHRGVHNRGHRFAVEIIGRNPVHPKLQRVIPHGIDQGLIVVGHGVHRVGHNAGHQTHEDREENPHGDGRQGRSGRMPAQHRKEDGQRQPEGDVHDGKKEKHKNPHHFFCLRHQSRGVHADGSDGDSHGEYHHGNDRRSGQKFPDNNGIPVNRLGYQPVQGSAAALAVDGVKAKGKPHDGTQERDKGGEGGNGASP